MGAIDVGPGAADLSAVSQPGYTAAMKDNPANGTGIIDTFEIWADTDLSGVKAAIFFVVSGDNLSTRDSQTIGSVTAGSKQTFSGLSIVVVTGDYLGMYWSGGALDADTVGLGSWYRGGDHIPCTNFTFLVSAYKYSIYGTGAEVVIPTVTTQAATNVQATTATGNGNVTNNGGENPDDRRIEWGTSSGNYPSSCSAGGGGTGAFSCGMTGLPSGTTIYCRAKAHNSAGWAYGNEVTFLTKPAAPTNVIATDGAHTDKVVITWTKSTGATGYQVYRNGVGLGWLGNVATKDDTNADAPTISPGTAGASDGAYTGYVRLTLSGEGTNNGTTHTYKVRARNATGESVDSSPNGGYRKPGTLYRQWQRSAGDSNGSYSNISGATTDPYNDTAAPAPSITKGSVTASDGSYTDRVYLNASGYGTNSGAGRYYRCYLIAAGCVSKYSTTNRGYRKAGTLYRQWQKSAGDSASSYSNISGATSDPYNYYDAPPSTITPGDADASDGLYMDKVALSLSGQSVANGAGRYYRAKYTASGCTTLYTSGNRGYRGHGALTYQWQRSSGDSDANYSNIGGATTEAYDDTGAPENGDGRYYRCVENATGATEQISATDRGYRDTIQEKFGSDAGSGVDTKTLAATLSKADTGLGAEETPTQIAAISKSDSGGGSDIVAQAEAILQGMDSGGGVDSLAQLLASLTKSDSGAGVEALGDRGLTRPDSGSGVDALSSLLASLSKVDAAIGTDNLVSLLVALAKVDTGTGLDTVIELFKGIIEKFGTDSGSGVDTLTSLLASLTKSDSGSGVEALLDRALALSQTGAGSDVSSLLVALSKSDSGSGVEALLTRAITLTESGLGADTSLLLASLLSTDTGAGLEAVLSRVLALAESGMGADISSLAAALAKVDASTGIDSILNRLIAKTETGSGVDAVRDRLMSLFESGLGAEASVLLASLTAEDAAIASEIASLISAITSTDAGIGADASSLLAEILKTDLGIGTDEVIGLLKEIIKYGGDSGSGVDSLVSLLAALTKSDSGGGAEAKALAATLSSADEGHTDDILEG